MSFEQTLQDFSAELIRVVPAYVLVFFRVSAMMVYAPLFGSAKIPKRMKALMASIISLGLAGSIATPVEMPTDLWGITMGIGGEIIFGLAMGMILSFIFIAVQWAGEMIGHQMGLNMSEVLDPQFGAAASVIGDLYYMLTLTIFLAVGGHMAMLKGVRASFDALPLLSVGLNRSLFDLLVSMFTSTTVIAFRLAGPMLVTMLIVDLSLGCISKTMPQLNIMTAGVSLRSVIGLMVLIFGLFVTPDVIKNSIETSMRSVTQAYGTPIPR